MSQRAILIPIFSFLGLVVLSFLSACSHQEHSSPSPTTAISTLSITSINTATITKQPSSTPTKVPSFTPTITITPTPEFIEPEDCLTPLENYDLIIINGMLFNQRTFLMLEQAQSIYRGEIDLTGYHLTQGSYSNLVSASFGTHNGGGAVDISVIQYGTHQVLYDEIDNLIHALRVAGFAAWLRDFDQLYPGSPIHIHAIAIGDRDLSDPALEQLTGQFGYFRGFNGIPQENGGKPIPDEHGGPILCQWMLDSGYADLRD
jgi:hypothetical protein